MSVLEQPGYAFSYLPRLNLRRPITANDHLAGIRRDRLGVFLAARTVVDDQPLGGCDDLRCRAVIAVDDVNLDVAILAREVQDEPHIRSPESIERLVVVADRPQVHARGYEAIDQFDLSGVNVLILIDKHMVIRPGNRRGV